MICTLLTGLLVSGMAKPRPDTVPVIVAARAELPPDISSWLTQASSAAEQCESRESIEAARRIGLPVILDTHPQFSEATAIIEAMDACLEALGQWRYEIENLDMGGSVLVASVSSSNTLTFGSPYDGDQRGTLVVTRGELEGQVSAWLTIERGQFACHQRCTVNVRFDDGPQERWKVAMPEDYSSDKRTIRSAAAFVDRLSDADQVRIEATFYQEGAQVLRFPVAHFDPPAL